MFDVAAVYERFFIIIDIHQFYLKKMLLANEGVKYVIFFLNDL